ncbi:serine hydrolase domain-containing protein [Wenzhouxiangella sp. EGI_FJ10305]|uniref:serine hydrolase domain-containing protein n=1 Tax=Wenzhouxiangella sp. EGI_FJ10305 TaxID=3243768 RepID=UPI0035DE684C
MASTLLKGLSAVLFCLLAVPVPAAQSFSVDTSAIDSFVTDRMESSGVPGVSLVIVDDGGVSYQKAYGHAGGGQGALDSRVPMCIGSLTKSFTALAVMQLVDREKIRLHEPVGRYIASFQSNSGTFEPVTVLHLLTHTSGFSTLQGNRVIQTSRLDLAKAEFLEALVEEIARIEPVRQAGGVADYSNANYLVLAQLVQQVSGMSYARYIRENIFGPLGMNRSFVRGEGGDHPVPAASFRFWFGYPVEYDAQIDEGPVGPTGVYSSAGDMGRYLLAMMNRDSRLLSAETFELLFDTVREHRSGPGEMGWRYSEPNGNAAFWHTGECPGATNVMAIFPEERTALAVMANARSGGFHFSRVGALVQGPLQMIVGSEPANDGPGTKGWAVLLFLVILIVALAVWAIRLVRSYATGSMNALKYPFDVRELLWRVGAPIGLLLLLCYGLLVVLPNLNDTTLWGVFLFAPDVAWLLTIGGGLAAGVAILRTVLLARVTLSVNKRGLND